MLRLALASAGLGAFELEPLAGRFRFDAHCQELLGLAEARVGRDAVVDQVHAEDRDRVRQALVGLGSRAPRDADVQLELRRPPLAEAAARRLELRGRLIHDDDGRPIALVGTLGDVTERRLVEQEREQRIDELVRTVRFGEMFVGILAHDLRNPLGSILMSAQLAGRGSTDPALGAALARIAKGGERIGRMVEQLLDFTCARVGAGIPLQLREVDATTVVREVVAELGAANPRCALTVDAGGDTTGSWDAERLAQIVSNLVGNAIEHGLVEHGVRVVVDGSDGDELRLEVKNQGLVPAEQLRILFNPFRAAHHRRDGARGLGLGLYVTRQIAIAHGGDADCTSTDPDGTTVRVRLPRRPGTPRPSAGIPLRELRALDALAEPPRATAVTARMFGAGSLSERAPHAYWELFEQYGRLLDRAIERQVFKESADQVGEFSAELRTIADRLGVLDAGAREVAELHARAIRQRTRGIAAAKAQALVAEGRLMAFELMGHLLSFHRRRAGSRGEERGE